MRQVGWGVIGCSDIVERRAAAAIVAQEQSRLVAFHSRNRARAEAFAQQFGAERSYSNLNRFLADDAIDVVYVATEVDRHAELAIAAANAGKHVLVEKPMALNVAECRAMIEAAARNNVYLEVAYYVRFFPKVMVMRQLIAEGLLGRIVRAHIRVMKYYHPQPNDPQAWRVTARAGGNLLADIGSHRIDLLTYFVGPPAQVAGFADRLTLEYDAADTETALVRFASGTHATVIASANVQRPDSGTTIEIYGDQGAFLIDPWSEDPVEIHGVDIPPINIVRPENAHAPIIDDFAHAVVEGRPPRFDGIDGMWATAVIAGTYESAQSGRVVTIDQPAPE